MPRCSKASPEERTCPNPQCRKLYSTKRQAERCCGKAFKRAKPNPSQSSVTVTDLDLELKSGDQILTHQNSNINAIGNAHCQTLRFDFNLDPNLRFPPLENFVAFPIKDSEIQATTTTVTTATVTSTSTVIVAAAAGSVSDTVRTSKSVANSSVSVNITSSYSSTRAQPAAGPQADVDDNYNILNHIEYDNESDIDNSGPAAAGQSDHESQNSDSESNINYAYDDNDDDDDDTAGPSTLDILQKRVQLQSDPAPGRVTIIDLELDSESDHAYEQTFGNDSDRGSDSELDGEQKYNESDTEIPLDHHDGPGLAVPQLKLQQPLSSRLTDSQSTISIADSAVASSAAANNIIANINESKALVSDSAELSGIRSLKLPRDQHSVEPPMASANCKYTIDLLHSKYFPFSSLIEFRQFLLCLMKFALLTRHQTTKRKPPP